MKIYKQETALNYQNGKSVMQNTEVLICLIFY